MKKIIFLLVWFFVIVDASIIQLSPLSAIIKDNNIKDAIVTINPKGKDSPLSYQVTNKTIKLYDGIPIFGLYEDFNNKIDIEYKKDNEIKKDTYYLQTDSIPHKQIKSHSIDDRFDSRFYLVISEDSAFIIDMMGNLRWIANIDKTNFIEKHNDKMFVFHNMAFDIINGKIFAFNTKDSAKILKINNDIFKINNKNIIHLDKQYKALNSWKIPFEIDVFNDISSIYYSDALFVSHKDSIIKLNKLSEIEWRLGGSNNSFQLVDSSGSKIICDTCNLYNPKDLQKIDFLSNKDIIYMIVLDNAIDTKARIYKLDEKLLTSEILWEYKIKDEVLRGSVAYKRDFHSIFVDYKDINRDLYILEFVWGETKPRVSIKIDSALQSTAFDVNNFLK